MTISKQNCEGSKVKVLIGTWNHWELKLRVPQQTSLQRKPKEKNNHRTTRNKKYENGLIWLVRASFFVDCGILTLIFVFVFSIVDWYSEWCEYWATMLEQIFAWFWSMSTVICIPRESFNHAVQMIENCLLFGLLGQWIVPIPVGHPKAPRWPNQYWSNTAHSLIPRIL